MKNIENTSLLAADCHGLHSQHELIHDIIGSTVNKTWTLFTCVLTL